MADTYWWITEFFNLHDQTFESQFGLHVWWQKSLRSAQSVCSERHRLGWDHVVLGFWAWSEIFPSVSLMCVYVTVKNDNGSDSSIEKLKCWWYIHGSFWNFTRVRLVAGRTGKGFRSSGQGFWGGGFGSRMWEIWEVSCGDDIFEVRFSIMYEENCPKILTKFDWEGRGWC